MRRVLEGWAPRFPDPTCVVWLTYEDADPTDQQTRVVRELEVVGEPGEVALEARAARHDLQVSPRDVMSYGPWEHRVRGGRDWASEYARLGVHLYGPEANRNAEIRWQRLARELRRKVAAPDTDAGLAPSLVIDRSCKRLIADLRAARLEDLDAGRVPFVDALTYALMAVPERWGGAASDLEDPVEIARRAFGRVGLPFRPGRLPKPPNPNELTDYLYGEEW